MTNENDIEFLEIKTRLDEIVNEVSEDGLALDEALSLYEEAINLGMQVSSLLEENISQEERDEALGELTESEQDDAGRLAQRDDVEHGAKEDDAEREAGEDVRKQEAGKEYIREESLHD